MVCCVRKCEGIDGYKYLKGRCKEDKARLFSVVLGDWTKINVHKLKHRRFLLNIRKHLFTLRVMEHWKRLPRDTVESRSLEISKKHPDVVLGNHLQVPLLEHGCWTR